MTKSKLCDPFFFAENSITGDLYLNILELFLEQQLQDDDVLDTVMFQYDGASPCFAYLTIITCTELSQCKQRVTSVVGFPFTGPYPLRHFIFYFLFFFAWGTSNPRCSL